MNGTQLLSDDQINTLTAMNSYPGSLTDKNLTLLYWDLIVLESDFKLFGYYEGSCSGFSFKASWRWKEELGMLHIVY